MKKKYANKKTNHIVSKKNRKKENKVPDAT